MQAKHWFLIGAGVLALASLYVFKQVKKLQNIKYKPGKPKVVSLKSREVIIDLPIIFTNDSAFDVTLKNYAFDVYVNNLLISKVLSDKPQVIAPKGDSTIVAGIKFNPMDVLKGVGNLSVISSLLLDKSKISVKINGDAFFSIAEGLSGSVAVNIVQPLSEIIK